MGNIFVEVSFRASSCTILPQLDAFTPKGTKPVWIDTSNKTPKSDATVTIYVAKGPMKGIHHECSLFEGDWYNGEDLVAPHSWVSHWRPTSKSVEPSDKIAGKTLSQWADLARQDDCFEHMVPGDLRIILQHVS